MNHVGQYDTKVPNFWWQGASPETEKYIPEME